MKTANTALRYLVLAGVGFVLGCAGEPAPPATTAPAHSGGLKAYIDPETGRLTDAPTADSQAEAHDSNEVDQREFEERDAPGGGKVVDLNGRFRSPSQADTPTD
jgi:hypothetical protein